MYRKIIFLCLVAAVTGTCDVTIHLKETKETALYHRLPGTGGKVCEITVQGMDGYKLEVSFNKSYPNGSLSFYNGVKYISTRWYSRHFYTNTFGNVFKIRYQSYSNDSGEVYERYKQYQSSCGELLTASTTEKKFSAIGIPSDTENDYNCFWGITRHSSFPLKLVIERLVFNHNDGFLEIYDKTKKLKRFEETITNPITLFSSSYFGIRYRGGSKSSLNATYVMNMCRKSFQLKENEASRTLTSSMLGLIDVKMDYFYRCRWEFISQPNYGLIVKVERNEKEEKAAAARNSLLILFSVPGNGRQLKWHPNDFSPSYLSLDGFLRLNFKLFSPFFIPSVNVTLEQFKPTCGEILKASSLPQTITIETGSASDCFWTIHGSLLKFIINELQLETGDYLKIFEGPYLISNITESLSSPIDFVAKNSLGMNILYHRTTNRGNLSVTYSKASCGETYKLINTSSSTIKLQIPPIIIITSARESFSNDPLICDFYFIAEQGHVIDMDIHFVSRSGYTYQYKVYDNNSFIGAFGNFRSGAKNIISQGRKVRLQTLISMVPYSFPSNFNTKFDLLTSVSTKQIKKTCGSTLVAKSTSKPVHFHGNSFRVVDCVWVITLSEYQYIQLTIEEIDINNKDGYLQVNGQLADLGRFRNEMAPIMFYSRVRSNNFWGEGDFGVFPRMTVYFHSGSNNASAKIRLSYKKVDCGMSLSSGGGNFEITRSLNSMHKSCDYPFITDKYSWIRVHVLNFAPNSCCYIVQFFQDNQLIASTKQGNADLGLLIFGNRFRVHYVTTKNSSMEIAYGYSISYLTLSRNCGSQLQANESKQQIASRGPSHYVETDIRNCVWTITANSPNKIQVTLESLHVRYDGYLEIYDGLERERKFDKVISSPMTYTSKSSMVRIFYNSGFTAYNTDFKATFLEVSARQ